MVSGLDSGGTYILLGLVGNHEK